jgi:hypothetical protein
MGVVRRAFGLAAGAALLALWASGPSAQPGPAMPAIDADDIGGVVQGPNGPEAGVWVIAETRDLPVRYIKVVVTDDQGRFVVPDLPAGATYEVWVRGYGLADSAKSRQAPGRTLTIAATPARNAAEAAQAYPAAYWYAMMRIPPKSAFSGPTRDPAFPETLQSQERWLNQMKNNGCVGCHQMGNLATRAIPAAFKDMSSHDAWVRRIQSGQAGRDMINQLLNNTGEAGVRQLAEWTDRIAAGETPRQLPPRPAGVERNIVVTIRDWLDDKHYLHDLISTDRRHPTVNAFGPVYGSPELSTDDFPILDPRTNTAKVFKAPVRDADTPRAADEHVTMPSAYWGEEAIWDSRANSHNPMIGRDGRVWYTATVRGPDNPAFCKRGSDHPSAKAFPNERAGRHLSVLDPKTMKYTFIDTCFSTHHLQFGYDADETLWTSGGGQVVGWLNTRLFDATGDAARAQGWTPVVLDTNGNGRRDAFTEPGQPADPAKDRRISAPFYAIMPNPADGSIWGADRTFPGSVVRIALGPDPSNTALSETYRVPLPGFGIRGADIDSRGVVWVSLASGHLGSFDRSKCRGRLNGPAATGDHCLEGWSFFRLPGPSFEGVPDQSVESSYYTWVDQHDTLGLGKDVPIVTGNLFDGFHALVNGRFVTLRTAYPLGFYAKGLDGRIDDPAAGWKGRGLWSSSGDRTPWHMEGGKGSKPLAVHIQVRPNPLAR